MWDHAFIGAGAGLFAGMAALSMLGRLVVQVGTMRAEKQGWGVVIAAAAFNSGTWVLVAILAGTGLMLRDDAPPWLPWFMAGVWTWVLGFGTLVAYIVRRPRHPVGS